MRSPVVHAPITAPTTARLAHSTTAVTYIFGYAEAFGPDPIRKKCATLAGVSATSKLVPWGGGRRDCVAADHTAATARSRTRSR
ncbi:hypothetical protein [Micromonospora sp. NPDC093277]|uniref:hypothetical protein n=1 Tax=Micromonospora sp. NPDC093277 TaxID=3364291 RepID=UPI0038133253